MRAEALVSLAGAEAALLAAGSRVQGLMLKIQQGEEAMARVEPLERALAAISEECRELREQQQQQRVPIASPDTRRLEEMVMELRGTLRDRDRELSEARQRVSRLTEDVERVAPLERELLRERARVAAQVATSARHAREMQSELRRIASRSESGRVEELGHILSDQRQRIMTLEQRVLQLQPGLAPYHPHHAADTFPRSSSSPQRTPSPPIARVDFTNPFNYPFRSEHPDAVEESRRYETTEREQWGREQDHLDNYAGNERSYHEQGEVQPGPNYDPFGLSPRSSPRRVVY
mmetsp:Transcript_5197/g.11450  ORF Transcript_5197/g.11450 Transcript_5197/m.11450 type:complete len:291 (+) Transcript_5197:133-1005(+)